MEITVVQRLLGHAHLNTTSTYLHLRQERLPARLSRREVAQVFNFRDEDSISVLVAAKLLKPLGNPPEGLPMWFATCEILRLSQNVKWLDKATKPVRQAVHTKTNTKVKA